jgi:hypothetical protein
MDKNKIALSSLALDLRRVALGYHRGSEKMADRFYEEALMRKEEIVLDSLKPYLQVLLKKFESLSLEENHIERAESALMYSTLFQNAALNL